MDNEERNYSQTLLNKNCLYSITRGQWCLEAENKQTNKNWGVATNFGLEVIFTAYIISSIPLAIHAVAAFGSQ